MTYEIDFLPREDSNLVVPLVGPGAADRLIIDELNGFGNPRARTITSTGPGLWGARVREVLPEVPQEMSLRGVVIGDTVAELTENVRYYTAAMDFMQGNGPADDPWSMSLLRLADEVGTLQRRVVVTGVDLPRVKGVGIAATRFAFDFEAWDPAWVDPADREQALIVGANVVRVGGRWPVYPRITLTAGGGGLINPSVVSSTEQGRGLHFTRTYDSGTVLTVDMDPDHELALVGDAIQNEYLTLTDTRFRLWPKTAAFSGDNAIVISYTGSLASAVVAWRELWPGA